MHYVIETVMRSMIKKKKNRAVEDGLGTPESYFQKTSDSSNPNKRGGERSEGRIR